MLISVRQLEKLEGEETEGTRPKQKKQKRKRKELALKDTERKQEELTQNMQERPTPEPQQDDLPELQPDQDEEDLEEHDERLIIAYINGEPVTGILHGESPLTEEHRDPKHVFIRRTTIGSHYRRGIHYLPNQNVWIRVKTSISQTLEQQQQQERKEKPKKLEELIPNEFLKYKTIFQEEAFNKQLPLRRPWDHAIELKEDFVP